MRKYISDIITTEIISKWKLGERYLIKSGTGSGKSHFVKNVLYEYCRAKGFRILLFSNRTILKNQNAMDLGDEKSDTITTVNYQMVESQVINKDATLDYYYQNYKVIVFDECHFFSSDSAFNRATDIFMQTIADPPKNKILLLISATPQLILKYYDFPKENIYDTKMNYDYVTQLSFYTKERTPEGVVQNLPEGSKCLFFGDAQESWELKNKFENSSFVCSQGNRLYKASEIAPVIKQIVENSSFDATLLATTKVIDNGVNLIDRSLQTIVINILDPITLIQCLGRKRVIDDDDTIRVFIKNQHRGVINFNYMKIKEQLVQLSDFENIPIEDFLKQYKKKYIFDVLDYDRNVNIAKKLYLIFMKDFYERVMEDKDGYKIEICKLLGKDYNEIKDGDVEVEKKDIRKVMDQWVGVKMFKEEREKFKQAFFNVVYAPKNTNYRHRAIRSITAVLLEDNLPYEINSKYDYTENRKNPKTIWMITRI